MRDPPFSRLDLVICRNLFIYLKPDAQHRVLDIFHFALRPGGLLFLGDSEHVDDGHTLFAPIDRKQRIHVRRTVPRPEGVTVSVPLCGFTAAVHCRKRYCPGTLPRSFSAGQDAAGTSIRGAEPEETCARVH